MTLVALALSAIALVVFFPVSFVSVALASLVTLGWASERLAGVGALEPAAFGGAVYLAGALLLVGAGLASLRSFVELLRSGSGEGGGKSLLSRWPWFVLGTGLMMANVVLIPDGQRESAVPGVVGASILATLGWVVITSTYLLFRLGKAVLRAGWRLARSSPYSAGLITAGGIGCVLLFLAVDGIARALDSSTSRFPSRPAQISCPTAMECWRQVFVTTAAQSDEPPRWATRPMVPTRGGNVGSGAGAPSLFSTGPGGVGSAGSVGGEPPSDFERCIAAYFAEPHLRGRAQQVAAGIVGESSADDVVVETLLSVCLHPQALMDLEPFLIKSIKNRAISWNRRPDNWRSCSIDSLPEPACELRPDDEYLREETSAVVRAAFCQLPRSEQELLRMRYFDELTESDIASTLGISRDAAAKRLERARARLREKFREKCQ